MKIRKKIFKPLISALIIVILLVTLSGCQMIGNLLNNTTNPETTGGNKITNSEKFALVMKNVLLDSIEKSDQITSTPLTLITSPDALIDNQEATYRKIKTKLTEPEEGETMTVVTETINNTTSGNSSMTVKVRSGGEVVMRSGIYFTDNLMLIKRGDTELPLIQHTLDPLVAESYMGIPAVDRFNRILSSSSETKMDDAEWSNQIDQYLSIIEQNTQENNYLTAETSIEVAGTTENCEEISLTLNGETAVNITSEFAKLINMDPTLKSYFVSPSYSEEETLEVTGMEGVLRDLNSLTPEEISGMTLTFKAQKGNLVSALYISAVTGEKSMDMTLLFYEDGYVRENVINFTGFDESKVIMSEENLSIGNNQYSGNTIYESYAPGGMLQETTNITSQSTISGNEYTTNTEFTYANEASASEEGDALRIGGELEYSQENNSEGTTGSGSGSFNTVSDGEKTTMKISIELEENNSITEVEPPKFIKSSGISTNDQSSLFTALDNESMLENYDSLPLSMRSFAAIMMIIF